MKVCLHHTSNFDGLFFYIMWKALDISKKRFGRLVAIKPIGKNHKGNYVWLCKCDCGKETNVPVSYLTKGSTTSCGCYRNELSRKKLLKHGLCNTRIYEIWWGIVQRCKDKNSRNYKNYGAKGITLCEEWGKFIPFYEWAILNGYKDDLTIERIDNSQGYYPDNCCWKTAKEHRSTNVFYVVNGEKLTIAEISEKYGVNYQCLHKRLRKYKWSIEKAITEPIMYYHEKK